MIYGLLLIVLGVLAAPSLILSKKPNAKELLDKLAPYQGWMGLVFAFWGLYSIINSILTIGTLATYPIWWITSCGIGVVEFVLGFLLGYSLIVKYVLSKNETAAKKGAELLLKLAPLQGTFGLIAICLGIWAVVFNLF